jgi:hypothetical protein
MTNAERADLIKYLEEAANAAARDSREAGCTPEQACENAVEAVNDYGAKCHPGLAIRWDVFELRIVGLDDAEDEPTVEVPAVSMAELVFGRKEAA